MPHLQGLIPLVEKYALTILSQHPRPIREVCVDFPFDLVQQIFHQNVDQHTFSASHWQILKEAAASGCEAVAALWNQLILKLSYCRLDVNVTAQTSHLLKAPFCIHPATNKVCIVIDSIDDFELESVPTIQEILLGQKALSPYLALLQRFVFYSAV
jgi:hypothetical protein